MFDVIKQRILSSSDGNFEEFLRDLIKNNCFEDENVEGIAKLATDQGKEALSEKQLEYLISAGLMDGNYVECQRGCEIPWEELFTAIHFYEDNLCTYCRKVFES